MNVPPLILTRIDAANALSPIVEPPAAGAKGAHWPEADFSAVFKNLSFATPTRDQSHEGNADPDQTDKTQVLDETDAAKDPDRKAALLEGADQNVDQAVLRPARVTKEKGPDLPLLISSPDAVLTKPGQAEFSNPNNPHATLNEIDAAQSFPHSPTVKNSALFIHESPQAQLYPLPKSSRQVALSAHAPLATEAPEKRNAITLLQPPTSATNPTLNASSSQFTPQKAQASPEVPAAMIAKEFTSELARLIDAPDQTISVTRSDKPAPREPQEKAPSAVSHTPQTREIPQPNSKTPTRSVTVTKVIGQDIRHAVIAPLPQDNSSVRSKTSVQMQRIMSQQTDSPQTFNLTANRKPATIALDPNISPASVKPVSYIPQPVHTEAQVPTSIARQNAEPIQQPPPPVNLAAQTGHSVAREAAAPMIELTGRSTTLTLTLSPPTPKSNGPAIAQLTTAKVTQPAPQTPTEMGQTQITGNATSLPDKLQNPLAITQPSPPPRAPHIEPATVFHTFAPHPTEPPVQRTDLARHTTGRVFTKTTEIAPKPREAGRQAPTHEQADKVNESAVKRAVDTNSHTNTKPLEHPLTTRPDRVRQQQPLNTQPKSKAKPTPAPLITKSPIPTGGTPTFTSDTQQPTPPADLSAPLPSEARPPPITTSAPQPPTLAQPDKQIQQMVAQIVNTQIRSTEILLSPEELGRIRLTLQTSEQGLTLVLQTERPETSDLMRRYADQLAEEFKNLGYSDLNFAFGGDQSSQHNSENRHAEPQNNGALDAVQTNATSSATLPTLTDGHQIDIRL